MKTFRSNLHGNWNECKGRSFMTSRMWNCKWILLGSDLHSVWCHRPWREFEPSRTVVLYFESRCCGWRRQVLWLLSRQSASGHVVAVEDDADVRKMSVLFCRWTLSRGMLKMTMTTVQNLTIFPDDCKSKSLRKNCSTENWTVICIGIGLTWAKKSSSWRINGWITFKLKNYCSNHTFFQFKLVKYYVEN